MEKGSGWAIFIGVVLLLALLGSCSEDETTTYYIDYDNNNVCDWGEAVYYEDNDGIHWLD